jgi:hypothetical protein
MTFNTMKIAGVAAVALVTLASSGASFAGSSPFCFAGGPTPKHVCDAIKANQKPKAVVGDQGLRTGGGYAVAPNQGRVIRR